MLPSKEQFFGPAGADIAVGNDPDADRHGIVTPSSGLLNPNHYLAVAIRYLLTNRPQWPVTAVVGKTLVSSCLIDRVVASLERTLWEVPVGFKWFTPGLFDGSCYCLNSVLKPNGRVSTKKHNQAESSPLCRTSPDGTSCQATFIGFLRDKSRPPQARLPS